VPCLFAEASGFERNRDVTTVNERREAVQPHEKAILSNAIFVKQPVQSFVNRNQNFAFDNFHG